MKRSPVMVALVLLLCLTVIPVSGLDTGVTIQGTEAAVGDIVYLPLSLEETQEANTVGISLTFDRSALEFVAGLSTWSISGTIRNFDRQKEYALWADSKTQSLSGELCRLAFRVREGAQASQCGVTCSVVLKIDTQEVAAYTAASEIVLKCPHDYGDWERLNDRTHSRACQLCGSEEYGAHEWDEGTVTKEPTQAQAGVRVYTCQLCGAEQEEVIPASGSPETTVPTGSSPIFTEPTRPQTTEPTRPQTTQPAQTSPTYPHTTEPQTTRPAQPGNQNDNSDTTGTISTQPSGVDGNPEESQVPVVPQEDVVVIKPSETTEETAEVPGTEPAAEPEAAPVPERGESVWIAPAVIGCLLAGGAGYWLVKKRKNQKAE